MDGSGSGGIGTWDTVTLPAVQNWFNTTLPDVAWSPGSDAVFGGTGGLVTVSTPGSAGVSVNNLTFNVDGYTIAGDPLNLTGAPTVTVTNAGQTATISAVVSQPGTATPNPNTFTKSGNGKLVISNPASVIDGRFTINAGEVVFGGSHTYTDATSPVVNSEVVGTSSTANAVLTLTSGATFNCNVGGGEYDPSMRVGRDGNMGVVNVQAGSTLNMAHKLVVGGGSGGLNQTGGTITIGGDFNMAWYGGNGVFNQSGGTLTHTGGALIMGTTAGTALVNLSGSGSFAENGTAANALQIAAAGTAVGTLNISDNASLSVPSSNINVGFSSAATDTSVGVLNLLGGTVSTQFISSGSSTSNSTGYVNFNGGTLKPIATSTTFMQGITNLATGRGGAFVYSGGAKIDTAGYDITIAEPLRAPTGNGVTMGDLNVSGSGYIYTPVVAITNGTGDTTGNGATAVANIDSSGNLTSITITSPGVGYTANPTITITGGGTGTTQTITGSLNYAPNTSGGLTKSGSGTLILTGANTYTGATLISGGSLDLSTGSIAGGVNINGTGATLVYNGSTFTPTVTATNGAIVGTGTINTVVVPVGCKLITTGNGAGGALNVNSLTFNGAGTIDVTAPAQTTAGIMISNLTTPGGGAKVSIDSHKDSWDPGVYYLINYTNILGGGLGAFQVGTLQGKTPRQSAVLNTSTPGLISVVIAGDNPKWTGYNTTTSLPDGHWTTSTTLLNWKLATEGTPTYYIEGDVARFDDEPFYWGGTSTLTISAANVTPSGVVFNSTSLPYTINGPFAIAGTGSLSVTNYGSATLNTNNSYTGGTTVALGTLTLAGVNTTNGATTLNSGTLNINNNNALGTGALTINGGTIDNTKGSLVTLATTNTMNWNADFAFGGTSDLDLGTQNNVALPATRTITVNDPAIAGTKLIVRGVISGSGYGINVAGTGKMTLYGTNTYTGVTTVNGGTLEIAGGSIGVSASAAPNIQISPNTSDTGTLLVTTGTVYADRVIIAGNVGNSSGGTGTLTQNGGTIWAREWFTVGSMGTGTYNMNGGTLNLTGQNMEVGNFSGTNGTVNMYAPAVINIQNNRPINLGANNNCNSGTFNQNGGTVTFYSDAGTTVGGTGVLALGNAGTSSGTFSYYLNGGTLTVPQIQTTAGTSAFYFNGGTLKAAKSNTTWMQGLTYAYINDGGAYINTNSFNVTIAQDLESGGTYVGGLIKQGAGILTLSAPTNGYYGPTEVQAGTLRINGNLPSSTVTVTAGTLDGIGTVNAAIVPVGGGIITNGSGATGTFTINSLTFNGAGTLNLISDPLSPANPALSVGTLSTAGSAVKINASAAYWAGGSTYTLVQVGSGSLADISLNSITGMTSRQSYVFNKAAGLITLAITGADHVVWTGAQNANWTLTTPGNTNWTADLVPTDFQLNDSVVFQDGAATSTVQILNGNVNTGYIKFLNNGQDFTINSSAGNDYGIAAGSVTVSGNGAVTLNTSNAYTGGTTINSGTLTLAGPNTTTTGVTTLNAGTLNINSAKALGTGALTINGGTIGCTSADVIATTNNALNLNVDVTFAGPKNLTLGTGTVTVTGTTVRTFTTNAGTLSIGNLPAYAPGYSKLGAGTLSIGGIPTGQTTLNIQAGTFQTRGNLGDTTATSNSIRSLTGAGTLNNTGGNYTLALDITSGNDTFDGAITDTASTRLDIVKNGTGTLTLTNANTNFNGRLDIYQGTVVFSGTKAMSASGVDSVSNDPGASTNAVLILTPGSVFGCRMNGSGSGIGRYANDSGSLQVQSGATLNAGAQIEISRNTTAFGALSLFSGSTFNVTSGNLRIGGGSSTGNNSTRGIVNQYGGNTTISGTAYTELCQTPGSIDMLRIDGGSFTSPGGMVLGAWNSTTSYTYGNATGILNLSGTAAVTLGGTRGLELGPESTNGIQWDAIANLNGGTLTTPIIRQRGAATVTTPTINLNGATIVASASSTTFFTGVSHAYVYSGGVTFNDNGNAITVGESLSAPPGSGVTLGTLGISTSSGYIDTPLVQITRDPSDTTGTGATAVANIDYSPGVSGGTGAVTGITITNPGVNYTAPPTISLLLGGKTATTTFSGALSTAVNANTGSLTKNGTGTLTLSGTNTYGGNTFINYGTLQATYPVSLPNFSIASQVQVASGATLAVNVGGTGQWQAADVLALNGAATLPTGSFLGIDTTGASFPYSYAITGNEGLKKLGANTLTLSGVNNYAGGTYINAGTLSVANNGNLGNAAGGLTFNGGSLAATGGVTMARQITLNASAGINTAGNVVEIGGNQAFTWANNVTLTVDGSTGGELKFNRSSSAPAASIGTNDVLQINAGATVELSGKPVTSSSVNITNNSGVSLVISGTTPQTTGAITGIGNIRLGDNSSLTVTSIAQNTMTIGAGATLTIAAIPGGPSASPASTISPVPEPATWAMLMLAAMGLGIYWHRSRCW